MTDASDPARGSSANWDRVDQVMFSWLDRPAEQVDRELANLRVEDPALAHAVESRLARVRWLGHLVQEPPLATGPRAGTTFGDYRIVRPLGQGGMGAVYLAEQPSLGRHVALKVIRSDKLRDHGARERFRREARAVADLRHPGICGVLDVGEVDDTPFLAMQYIDGETLAERLTVQRAEHAPGHDSGAPTTAAQIGSVLQLIETVARALHAAHEAGVVHRDVKPANVMLDRDGQPVLLDFGLAQVAAADGDPTLTLSGDLLGTPAYMSPEQVRPQGRTIDRRTDVYSLAVTLFECLTLQRPFAGSTQADLYERIVRDPTPDPRRSNPDLPADVGAVLGKAMEKEPGRRYATAAEFAEELARLRRHEPVRARRVGVFGRASRWARRNPRAAALMLALSLALGGASALLRQTIQQREEIRATAAQAMAEARRAEEATVRETQRAEELQQVAEFQATQLREIDPVQMGVDMRRSLLAEVRQAMDRSKHDAAQTDARVAELEADLAGANFTDLALSSLRDGVFERTLASIATSFGEQPLVRAHLLQAAADALRQLGMLDLAVAPQQEALQLRTELLAEDDLDRLESQSSFGALLIERGELAEALPIVEDHAQHLGRVLGMEHRASILALRGLADLYSSFDRDDEAETTLLRAQQTAQRALPTDDPLRATLGMDLGSLRQKRGDVRGAEACFRQAYEQCRLAVGDTAAETLTARNHLGMLLAMTGQFAEAKTLLQQNLDIRRTSHGAAHPDTLESLNNMALLLYQSGDYEAAVERYRELVHDAEQILGPYHPHLGTALGGLASAACFVGSLDEAEASCRRSLDIARRCFGEDGGETLQCLGNLTAILMRCDKAEEAEACCRETLDRARDNLGPDHPVTIDATIRMGQLLLRQGQLDQAEPCFTSALDAVRRVLPDGHPRILDALNALGSLLIEKHAYAEAEQYLQEAASKARDVLGMDHRNTLTFVHNLGYALEHEGKTAEAERCFRDCLAAAKRLTDAAPDKASRQHEAAWWLASTLITLAKNAQDTDRDAATARLREAEQLLVARAEWLARALDANTTSATDQTEDAAEACDGVADLYDYWHSTTPDGDHGAQAVGWRQRAAHLRQKQ